MFHHCLKIQRGKVNSEEVVEIVKRIVDESEKTNTHANSNTEVIEETVNKKVHRRSTGHLVRQPCC
jgi:hypothetical protein